VTCTSTNGGAPGTATGTVSPITVTHLTPGATYTCTVTASNGSTTIAASTASAPVLVDASGSATVPVAAPSTLPRTGVGSLWALIRAGSILLGFGLALLLAVRRRRAGLH